MMIAIGNYIGSPMPSTPLNSAVSAWRTQGLANGGVAPSDNLIHALSDYMNSMDSIGWGPSGSNMVTWNLLTVDKEFIKLNVKNPATYKYSEVGTVTLTSGQGCKSDGASYWSQPFAANEYAGIQSTLFAMQYVSQSNAVAATQSSHGMRVATGTFYMLRPFALGQGIVLSYDATANVFTSGNHKGWYGHWNDSANSVVWKDLTKDTLALSPTVPTQTNNRYILARNNGGVADEFYTSANVAIDALFRQVPNDATWTQIQGFGETFRTAAGIP